MSADLDLTADEAREFPTSPTRVRLDRVDVPGAAVSPAVAPGASKVLRGWPFALTCLIAVEIGALVAPVAPHP